MNYCIFSSAKFRAGAQNTPLIPLKGGSIKAGSICLKNRCNYCDILVETKNRCPLLPRQKERERVYVYVGKASNSFFIIQGCSPLTTTRKERKLIVIMYFLHCANVVLLISFTLLLIHCCEVWYASLHLGSAFIYMWNDP